MATTTVNLGLSLDGLSNVDTTGKNNGDILVWNSSLNKWVDATPISGGTPAGTSGQVQFNNAGSFGADSAFHWDNTNKRLGVGISLPQSRLDVQAQGALSTDIALRVRNSANTANLFQVLGNGTVWADRGVSGNCNFGEDALNSLSSGASNTALGYWALRNNSTGGANTAIGRDTLKSGNSSDCTAVGYAAMSNTTGGQNTAVGHTAGQFITTGIENVSIGFQSMGQAGNKTGQRNVCIGSFAATALTSGSSNILIGRNTGSNITTGSYNTLIGENLSTAAAGTNNNVILADGQGNQVIRKDANHNQILGVEAALATTATNGFTYIPTCAGTPTGTPTAITGKVPIVADTTNNKLYVYLGGAWVAMN